MYKYVLKKHKLLSLVMLILLLFFAAYKIILAELIKINLGVASESIAMSYGMLLMINFSTIGLLIFINFMSSKYHVKFLTACKKELNNLLFQVMMSGQTLDSSSLTAQFNNEIPLLIDHYFSPIISLVYFGFSTILGVLYLWRINHILLIVLLIIAFSVLLLTKVVSYTLRKTQNIFLVTMSEITTEIMNYVRNYKIIAIFDGNNVMQHRLKVLNASNSTAYYQLEITGKKLELINDSGSWIIIVTMYLVGIYLIMNKQLEVAELVASVQASSAVITPILWSGAIMKSLSRSKDSVSKFNKQRGILGTQICQKQYPIAQITTITCQNLAFNQNDVCVLGSVNMQFSQRQKTIITGESGSGKTTFVNSLLGFAAVKRDMIYVNDLDIVDLDVSSYYERMSYVEQEGQLMNTTIRDNILMGAAYDSQRLNEVVEIVELTKLVEERGQEAIGHIAHFSGGERQRINIARALYKKSDVLILDEAFSALPMDQTDRIIRKVLEDERIIISIMHKYSEEIKDLFDEVVCLSSTT